MIFFLLFLLNLVLFCLFVCLFFQLFCKFPSILLYFRFLFLLLYGQLESQILLHDDFFSSYSMVSWNLKFNYMTISFLLTLWSAGISNSTTWRFLFFLLYGQLESQIQLHDNFFSSYSMVSWNLKFYYTTISFLLTLWSAGISNSTRWRFLFFLLYGQLESQILLYDDFFSSYSMVSWNLKFYDMTISFLLTLWSAGISNSTIRRFLFFLLYGQRESQILRHDDFFSSYSMVSWNLKFNNMTISFLLTLWSAGISNSTIRRFLFFLFYGQLESQILLYDDFFSYYSMVSWNLKFYDMTISFLLTLWSAGISNSTTWRFLFSLLYGQLESQILLHDDFFSSW